MSGLDSSQQLTDDVSLHSEEFHVHSHPEKTAPVEDGAPTDPEPDQERPAQD
jgi:hypothetical protein